MYIVINHIYGCFPKASFLLIKYYYYYYEASSARGKTSQILHHNQLPSWARLRRLAYSTCSLHCWWDFVHVCCFSCRASNKSGQAARRMMSSQVGKFPHRFATCENFFLALPLVSMFPLPNQNTCAKSQQLHSYSTWDYPLFPAKKWCSLCI